MDEYNVHKLHEATSIFAKSAVNHRLSSIELSAEIVSEFADK